MAWYDFYKLFTYAFTKDPLSQKVDTRILSGSGVTQPDAQPELRGDGNNWGSGQGLIRMRDSQDFIDLSSVTNRQSRYQEYDRLRNVAEIETAMSTFANEACVAGDTLVATPSYGLKSIKWLTENVKDRFLVYCYDFKKGDYTLGWAFNPRITKTAMTQKISLDDGTELVATHDHRILLRSGVWTTVGQLQDGDELMPFYRLRPNQHLTKEAHAQYPRIWTHKDGWKNERMFINEWSQGRPLPQYEKIGQAIRMFSGGLGTRKVAALMKHQWRSIDVWLRKEGFSAPEVKCLGKRKDRRRVIGINRQWKEMDVYDLSVEKHENFCTDSLVLHNCQKDDDGNVFKIDVKDSDVQEELEFLFFQRGMLNMNRRLWNLAKNLFIKGDLFLELVISPENPKQGVYKTEMLPPDTMFRIETTKGKLVEFQQSKEQPDYQALTRAPVTQATDAELDQATAVRFAPEQIVHIKIGDDRKTFYPYGISLIEAARGPAHQLRMMEDAMVVYRLTRAPERRVFYIDVGTLPPFKAEAFMERMKDQYRKKKTGGKNANTSAGANNAVEERWHAPSQDEDFWIPMRANSNTRVETLPGAQNLGEIDDAVYFRNKLFTALQFPKSYFSPDVAGATRITLSAQDCRFAQLIERLQGSLEDGMWEIADRHLKLRGFPEESYEDLKITMTPPSPWRELSLAEVMTNRINNAGSLKGSQIMSTYDILTKMLKYSDSDAMEMLGRLKIDKLDDLKLQIIAQNPTIAGVGTPGQNEPEMGAEAGAGMPGMTPDPSGGMPPGDPGAMPPGGPPPGGTPPAPPPPGNQAQPAAVGEPDPDDIQKYDLEIGAYGAGEQEDIDWSLGE